MKKKIGKITASDGKVAHILKGDSFDELYHGVFRKDTEFAEFNKIFHLKKKVMFDLNNEASKKLYNNLKHISKDFGLEVEISEDSIKLSVIDSVLANFCVELAEFGVQRAKIKGYLKDIADVSLLNKSGGESIFEFYIAQALLKQEVNIYIFQDKAELASLLEMLPNRTNRLGSYITINLNKVLTEVMRRDCLFENALIALDDPEQELLREIRVGGYTDINIELDKKKLGMMKKIRYTKPPSRDDLCTIAKTIKEIGYGKLTINIHNGKAVSGENEVLHKLD